jgi:hypothetical protein
MITPTLNDKKEVSLQTFINKTLNYFGNKRYRQGNPFDEAILCFKKATSRCDVVV